MTLKLESLVIYDRNGQALFSPLNMKIMPGAIAVIMGPSGCGKSTTLNLIAGHLSHDFSYQGTITLNGQTIFKVPPHQRKIGLLFQDDLLFPHLNIWQNLAFALPNSVTKSARRSQALQALEELGLQALTHSYPNQISGGQRARISLIRLLLAKPTAVLLDEPFSKLDAELRLQFREWVFEQLRSQNIPTLLVTHDQNDIPEDGQLIDLIWTSNHAR